MSDERAGRCVWCDAYFTWTPTGPKDPVKLFCKKQHAEAARKANKRFMAHFPEGVCPTPQKVKHRSPADALAALQSMVNNGACPYKCNCGFWHVGRPKRGPWVEDAQQYAARIKRTSGEYRGQIYHIDADRGFDV